MYACMYVCMQVYMYMCMYVSVYVCMCVCVCVYVPEGGGGAQGSVYRPTARCDRMLLPVGVEPQQSMRRMGGWPLRGGRGSGRGWGTPACCGMRRGKGNERCGTPPPERTVGEGIDGMDEVYVH